jgi:hypothetical protein
MVTAASTNTGLIWPKRTFVNMIDQGLRKLEPASLLLAAKLRASAEQNLGRLGPSMPQTLGENREQQQPMVAKAMVAPPPLQKYAPAPQARLTPNTAVKPQQPVSNNVVGTPQPMTSAAMVTTPSALRAIVATPQPAPKPEIAIELPTPVRLRAVDFQRRQQLLVSQINRSLKPGCHVLAWNILPLDLFQGEIGRFLMIACDFHAYGPGNTMLLPAMPAGSQELSLPRHPLVASDAYKADAQRRISLLRTKVSEGHKRASLALQQGDLSQLFLRTEQQQSYRQELLDITRNLATALFGKQALASHEEQFRTKINAL